MNSNMARRQYVYRTTRNPPIDEIRVRPSDTSWSTFCSTHSDLLSVYQIVTKEVLSSVPISLGKLLKVLKIKYGLPLHLTERFINFISTIETKDIIFEEEPSTGVRQPFLFTNRQDKQISGRGILRIRTEKKG